MKALFATSLSLVATYVSMYFAARAYAQLRQLGASHGGFDFIFEIGYFFLGWFILPGAASLAGLLWRAKSVSETRPRLAGVYSSYLASVAILVGLNIVVDGGRWFNIAVIFATAPLLTSLPWVLIGIARLAMLSK